MPDLISRYLSNVLTIDQIETLSNKFLDGEFNTFSNIPNTALDKIIDKAKLPDDIMYSATEPYVQTINQHANIQIDGLSDGQILQYEAATSKWKNVTMEFVTVESGVLGAANLAGTGATVFANETTGILNFNRIRSMSTTALAIANVGNEIQLTLTDATSGVKGVVMLNANGGTDAGKAVVGNDSRLTNTRAPTAHASTHLAGQADKIKLDDLEPPDDNTDLDASTLKHGLLKKLPGNTTTYLRGDGSFASISVPTTGVTTIAKEVDDMYISNDSSERTLISHVVPGGSLGTDGILRIEVGGEFYNATSGGKYLGFRVKIDNTTLWGTDIGTITEQGNSRGVFLTAKISQRGSTSAQNLTGFCLVSDDQGASYGGVGGQDDDEGCYDMAIKGSSNINWTTDHTVSITCTLSDSDGQLSFDRNLATIEQM